MWEGGTPSYGGDFLKFGMLKPGFGSVLLLSRKVQGIAHSDPLRSFTRHHIVPRDPRRPWCAFRHTVRSSWEREIAGRSNSTLNLWISQFLGDVTALW